MSPWGERISILANLGVFLGFLVVAWQLNLTTRALESGSVQMNNALFAQTEQAFIGETGYQAYTQALLAPECLTPEELMQVWAYSASAFFAAFQAWEDYRHGLLSEERWTYTMEMYISYINHPVGRGWNDSIRTGYGGESMRGFWAAMDARLAEVPENLTALHLREMMAAQGIQATGRQAGCEVGAAPNGPSADETTEPAS